MECSSLRGGIEMTAPTTSRSLVCIWSVGYRLLMQKLIIPLQLTRQHRDVHPFEISTSWNRALSSISPESSKEDDLPRLAAPICIIKGPRKTGKSTFARTLLNRLVTRYVYTSISCTGISSSYRYRKVAFLECDLGQSEFTPGGMVALNIIEQPLFGMLIIAPGRAY